MNMIQKLCDERAKFRAKTGQEPVTATLTYDEGFKLLEEIRDTTKAKKPRDAMTRVLLSRSEEDLIDIFKGSTIFGMTINIERILQS